jgi:hypothetical protein
LISFMTRQKVELGLFHIIIYHFTDKTIAVIVEALMPRAKIDDTRRGMS